MHSSVERFHFEWHFKSFQVFTFQQKKLNFFCSNISNNFHYSYTVYSDWILTTHHPHVNWHFNCVHILLLNSCHVLRFRCFEMSIYVFTEHVNWHITCVHVFLFNWRFPSMPSLLKTFQRHFSTKGWLPQLFLLPQLSLFTHKSLQLLSLLQLTLLFSLLTVLALISVRTSVTDTSSLIYRFDWHFNSFQSLNFNFIQCYT